jgi:hypothetical protein
LLNIFFVLELFGIMSLACWVVSFAFLIGVPEHCWGHRS